MKILLSAFLMLCMFKVQAAPPIDLSHAVAANYNNQLHPYNLPHDFEKAESPTFLRIVAYALAYTGGALIGYTAGSAITGNKANWAVAGVGAGLIGIAVPIGIIDKKHNGY